MALSLDQIKANKKKIRSLSAEPSQEASEKNLMPWHLNSNSVSSVNKMTSRETSRETSPETSRETTQATNPLSKATTLIFENQLVAVSDSPKISHTIDALETWWSQCPEIEFRVLQKGTPKQRLITFLCRSIEDEIQCVTRKFSHQEILKAVKISDANLKKMILRLTKDFFIYCDKKQDYKAGTGGWVRYRVHPKIMRGADGVHSGDD